MIICQISFKKEIHYHNLHFYFNPSLIMSSSVKNPIAKVVTPPNKSSISDINDQYLENVESDEDDAEDRLVIIENNNLPCSFCEKEFPDERSLLRHEKTFHKGSEIYQCESCKKEFAYKSHYNIHLRYHSGEKPHTCDICFKKCSSFFNLKWHVLDHSRVKRFECEVCSKKFLRRNSLNVHVRTHTGEKPFVCSICKREFTHSNSYKYHVTTHKTQTFTCDTCGKTFTEKFRLDWHRKNHDQSNKDLSS